ncbi:MAG: polysaccharide deacetylase family protein [Pirellulales bacterium]
MSTEPANEWFCEPPSRLRVVATRATTRAAAGLQRVCGNRCRAGFGILMYHRVAEHVPGVSAPTLNVTPRTFRAQLAGLLQRGFVAWPLQKLVRASAESRPIPASAFAVTFDDGYENNFTNAWPILRELQVPATIFVATKYLETNRPFPFDDWPASGSAEVPATAWRPMSLDECRELQASGLVELGAHTHSHGRYVGRGEYFRRDLQQNLDIMREQFGIERPTFAFPYGVWDQEMVSAARELGVTCSLTTHRRRIFPGDSPYAWGRFDAESGDTVASLAAKLSGWYTTIGAAGKSMAWPVAQLKSTLSRLSVRRDWASSGSEASTPRKAASQT